MFNHKHAVRDQGSSVIVGINKKITFFFFFGRSQEKFQ